MTRCHCPVMSVITYVCFWVSAHSLKSLASFEAFPGLQTNMSWTMIIKISILPACVRVLKHSFRNAGLTDVVGCDAHSVPSNRDAIYTRKDGARRAIELV